MIKERSAMDDDPNTLEAEHHEPPQRRPTLLVTAGIIALFLAGLFVGGWMVLSSRVQPQPSPPEIVPPTGPEASTSVGGAVELATQETVCGDGVCDLAAENSDLCPQDCQCQDDGLAAAGEGCGCRDVLCSGEDVADLCGVPCPQDRCDNGFACAGGVCWDAVCGPTPTFTASDTLTWTPTLTSSATSTATSTATLTPTVTPTRTVAPTVAACGNGVCEPGENSDLCASDCQCVDNGVCEAGEGSGCRDCGASAGGCGSPCAASAQCAAGFACAGGVCWDACTCQGQCGGEVAPNCGACFDGPGIWGPPTTGCIFACNCCEFTPTDACGNPCLTYPACDLTAPYCG